MKGILKSPAQANASGNTRYHATTMRGGRILVIRAVDLECSGTIDGNVRNGYPNGEWDIL
jgi:hypothetical protein